MIKQGFNTVSVNGTERTIIASILSKGVPASPEDFPLDGADVTGFTKEDKFFPVPRSTTARTQSCICFRKITHGKNSRGGDWQCLRQ